MKYVTQRIPRIAKAGNRRLVKNLAITATYEQFINGQPFQKVKSNSGWWRRENLPGRFVGDTNLMICKFERSDQNTGGTTFAATIEEENADRAIVSGIDPFNETCAYRLIFKK